MNIIIEGPDGGGKSTLARFIAQQSAWKIVASVGPAANDSEFNQRVRTALSYDHTIFDRHPCISERIYGAVRGKSMLDPDLERKFYASNHVIIYYRSPGTLSSHKIKPHDSSQHVAMVEKHHFHICDLYDTWALQHAHMIYRRDESKPDFMKLLQGRMS